MSDKVFVRPAEGRSVPRPDGTAWPAAGDWTVRDGYVRRRLADGDLVEAAPPAAPETSAAMPDEHSTEPHGA